MTLSQYKAKYGFRGTGLIVGALIDQFNAVNGIVDWTPNKHQLALIAQVRETMDDLQSALSEPVNTSNAGSIPTFGASIYAGMTEAQKKEAHNIQVRQMMDGGA